jgi:hypothetical protein
VKIDRQRNRTPVRRSYLPEVLQNHKVLAPAKRTFAPEALPLKARKCYHQTLQFSHGSQSVEIPEALVSFANSELRDGERKSSH